MGDIYVQTTKTKQQKPLFSPHRNVEATNSTLPDLLGPLKLNMVRHHGSPKASVYRSNEKSRHGYDHSNRFRDCKLNPIQIHC